MISFYFYLLSSQIPALSDVAYMTQPKQGISRRLAKGRTGQALMIVKLIKKQSKTISINPKVTFFRH